MAGPQHNRFARTRSEILQNKVLDATNDITAAEFSDAGGDPTTIAPDAAASDGVAGHAARRDHTHAIVAAAPSGTIAPGSTANAEGSATSFARSDHTHAVSSTGGAPTDATYITQTANGALSAEQPLAALSTGILKVTTATGVLSTAVGADLPSHDHAASQITSEQLIVAQGGTGAATLTSGAYLKGAGTSAVTAQATPLPHADIGTAWTNWTPTCTQTGTLTLTVGRARYCILGKLAIVSCQVIVASGTGTAGQPLKVLSIPSAIDPAYNTGTTAVGVANIYDASAADYWGVVVILNGTNGQVHFTTYPDPGAGNGVWGTDPSVAVGVDDQITFTAQWEIA